MKVIWTPRAQQRLQKIHDDIAKDSPGNAARWLERVLDRGEQIAHQPRSGRVVRGFQRDTIREIFEGNYRIVYRILPERIDVLTVRHGARLMPSSTRGF